MLSSSIKSLFRPVALPLSGLLSDYCPILASSCHGSQTYFNLSVRCLISLTLHIFATSLTSFSDHSLLINIDSFKCRLPIGLPTWSWYYKTTSDYLPTFAIQTLRPNNWHKLLPQFVFTHKTNDSTSQLTHSFLINRKYITTSRV